jgi:biopolymer transport protein ExbD
MPFVFHCPSCGAAHSAGEALIGRQVRCPKCGDVVAVSRPPASSARFAEAPNRGESWREPTAARPASDAAGKGADDAKLDFGPKREAVEASMDMTPMVDVTFQLLIFFMVTAAFSMQKSIEIPKPEQDEQVQAQPIDPQIDPNCVIVKIDENDTYQILYETIAPEDAEAGSEQELLQKLRYARDTAPGGSPPSKLLVQAHGDAHHEYVVRALDAGTAVGMEQVQLMTVEEME